MELKREELELLKTKYLHLIDSLTRDGVDKQGLIDYLYSVNFFEAPYSSQYSGSYKGGLLKHSLDTYENLVKIYKTFGGTILPENAGDPTDTFIILGLLHDIGKADLYEEYFANKKIYSQFGNKSDENGKFSWVSVPAYKIKDSNSRFILGTSEENSLYLIQNFVPLYKEETAAILNCKGGRDQSATDCTFMTAFTKYTLALYLFMADSKATFKDGYEVDE